MNLPFFKLPFDQDLILYLIRKELQDVKFANELGRLGFDSTVFNADLGVAILSLSGFTDRDDELWEWYFQTLHAFAERFDLGDKAKIDGLALEFYLEMREQKKSNGYFARK